MGELANKKPPVPTYIKFYSVYKYDRQKFKDLLNKWLATDEGKNRTYRTLKEKQKEILKVCYEKDALGNKARESDERHIYRANVLPRLLEIIFKYSGVSPFETRERIELDGLYVYPEEQQAEIPDTWKKSLYDRIKIHIKLLRLLRYGYTPKEALDIIEQGVYEQFRALERETVNKEKGLNKVLVKYG